MEPIHLDKLKRFGFSFKNGSVLTKRTIMLRELTQLFEYIENENADIGEYKAAICDDNCLGKRSMATRKYTFQYLRDLYALDHSKTLLRILRFFWIRDIPGRPMLAFLCAYARDSLLRATTSYVLNLPISNPPSKSDLHELIEHNHAGRFGNIMMSSLGRNLLSSWTQSGHFQGHKNKVRIKPSGTPGAISYALLLGYLNGERGVSLFQTEFISLFDSHRESAIEQAEISARHGWIVLKRIGDVIEVSFPSLLSDQEMEWIREQN